MGWWRPSWWGMTNIKITQLRHGLLEATWTQFGKQHRARSRAGICWYSEDGRVISERALENFMQIHELWEDDK